MTEKLTRVVIVGGGFGGLEAAKRLGRELDTLVTVIDRRNHHLFQPLLYQVAMAGLSPSDIAMPIRTLLSKYRNTEVLMGEALRVDRDARQLICDFGRVPYDYLILACGASHSYFGHGEWEEHAPGLKTLEQAVEIRRRVLLSFELAERERDPARRRMLQTFVVVGGGATGVELAGALGEISRHTLSRDFDHIDPGNTRIILIEAEPRILGGFDERLSRKAMRDLERLGVTVWTSTRVSGIQEGKVTLGNETVEANTIIWAAGVKPSPFNARLELPLDPIGRLIVNKDLTIPGSDNIYAIGDQIRFENTDGTPLPGQAPAAMQQGRWAARNILRAMKGKTRLPFKFTDKGQMATIGRKRAIAEFKGLRMSGPLAWWAWLLVHIYYLVGFKNRLFVMIQWAWAYFTWGKGARLVTGGRWQIGETGQ
ncbi:MAG: hypothetical protein RIQ81_972 [Pseudomonadota bacterium]|jgi:NADH dehydrogenase